ncbi:hypothetical protein [Dysgonomonas sp. ZJ279]|uniref:hypothetical protein n=1 Tax=Dysgonomonas sp. ZJ279 TaxID=2709796 RepID=UPI0013EB6276|nr:hypothetical protein [Dysgonomonas sp. ZJ279]
MSSRKDLKKQINASMDLLYGDCVFYKVFVMDADKDAADKVIAHIAEIHGNLLKRVSVSEGKEVKGRTKAYYKKLRSDIQEQINIIGKEITALG